MKNLFMIKKHFVFLAFTFVLVLFSGGTSFAATKLFYYHTDPSGTPLAMTDGTTGDVVWETDYLPFGEVQSTVSTEPNNREFIGKERDSETGLYYFGARYMDDSVGRFLSTDPVTAVDPFTGSINLAMLSNPQRQNLYGYSLNNPYKYLDPDGNVSTSIDGYFFLGGGVTYGVNPDGRRFISLRVGPGVGGGYGGDLLGTSPGYDKENPENNAENKSSAYFDVGFNYIVDVFTFSGKFGTKKSSRLVKCKDENCDGHRTFLDMRELVYEEKAEGFATGKFSGFWRGWFGSSSPEKHDPKKTKPTRKILIGGGYEYTWILDD